MKKTRVAIIGTGGIANVHAESYKNIQDAELCAACDLDREKLDRFADKYGIPRDRTFTDYHEMLKLPDIDAVSVCTWNAQHAPAAIASLRAGKHVLCEKPMAMNAAEAESMQAEAEKAGRLLMVGFVRRYGNDAEVVKNFIDSGSLGDIYFAKATYLRRHGFPGGWFGDRAYSGGGPLIDLGVHVIDLSRYLMGNPLPVSVYGATFHKLGRRPELKSTKGYASTTRSGNFQFNVEDFATAMIRFDNGALLTVETSFDMNVKQDVGNIELFGTKAGVKLDPELEIYTDMNGYLVNVAPSESTALSFDGLFDKEVAHFIDCVRNGTVCRSPASDGVELMRILDAVYRSADEKREVVIER